MRYLQVSTDEVFGDSIDDPASSPSRAATPSSPVQRDEGRRRPARPSYFHTFGARDDDQRCSNNYGPYQYPEKLIPLMILNALHGDALPVYGDGMHVRDWLYVEDFTPRHRPRVLDARRARRDVQLSAAADECPNNEVVKRIIELTGAARRYEHVTDRPGHDRRYSLDSEKLRALGWEPRVRVRRRAGRRRRLVSRQRLVVGAEAASGRLPRATTGASTGARRRAPAQTAPARPPLRSAARCSGCVRCRPSRSCDLRLAVSPSIATCLDGQLVARRRP